jgi:transcriptional regulator with XRE-family HTH domain
MAVPAGPNHQQLDRTTATMTASLSLSSIPSSHDPSWDVDRHVGARLRARRLALGLTQQRMAALIGVTYQQAQKYETGANRMTAQRLHLVAQVLGVDIDYFFADLDHKPSASERQVPGELAHLLTAIARSYPEIVQAVMQAIAGQASPMIDPAPAGRDASRSAMPLPWRGAGPVMSAARPQRL